jgi:hypothetical protein
VFRRTIIGGFSISIVFASACILFFSELQKEALVRTSIIDAGEFKGPLIDLIYWFTFGIFVAITASPAVERIVATWGRVPVTSGDRDKPKTMGVSIAELLIFAAIWGACLAGAQQRILAAFVFERAPAQPAVPN